MSIVEPPPVRLDSPDLVVSLTNCLIPWKANDQPVLLEMPGSPHEYLPTFTTEEKLRACMSRARVSFAKIKQINHGGEFLDSIPLDIVVIQDPWFTVEGKVRFTQVQR